MNFINRSINSNKYQNAGTNTIYPLVCGQDMTKIVAGCANTNKIITSIIIEITMVRYLTGSTFVTKIVPFQLKLFSYDPVAFPGYIKILKSDPQQYTPIPVTNTIPSIPLNFTPGFEACFPSVTANTPVCGGVSQFGYTSGIASFTYSMTIFAISCGVQQGGNFRIYILLDNFIDTGGNQLSGGYFAAFVNAGGGISNNFGQISIACPSIQNGNYIVNWSANTGLGIGTLQTCMYDLPFISNVTVVQQ